MTQKNDGVGGGAIIGGGIGMLAAAVMGGPFLLLAGLGAAAGAVIAATSSDGASAIPDSANQMIEEGRQLLESGQYARAVDLFRNAYETIKNADGVSSGTKNAAKGALRDALMRLGVALGSRGQAQQAIPILKEALSLSGPDIELANALADAYETDGDKTNAIGVLEGMLKNDPHNPSLYRRISALYADLGKRDQAASTLETALGRIDDRVAQSEFTERLCRCLDDSSPKLPGYLDMLGELRLDVGNLSEALEAWNRFCVVAPGDTRGWLRVGILMLDSGRMAEASAALDKAKGSDSPLFSIYLGRTINASGRPDAALVAFRQGVKRYQDWEKLSYPKKDEALATISFGRRGKHQEVLLKKAVRSACAEAGIILLSRKMKEEACALGDLAWRLHSDLPGEACPELKQFAEQAQTCGLLSSEEAHTWGDRFVVSATDTSPDDSRWKLFWDRFEPREWALENLIGEGGMGAVYQAAEISTGRPVAVKRMYERYCRDRAALSFFEKEVAAMELLSKPKPHPNVVEILGSGVKDDQFVFAMEFVDGENLESLLDRGGLANLQEFIRMVAQICDALEHVHARSIVHRDLKPANILLTRNMEVKLTDFGISRVPTMTTSARRYHTRTKSFVGTSLYSSPEQYPDEGVLPPIDHRADIYSLGCIMYEMLTSQPPYVHDDPGIIGMMHCRRSVNGNKSPEPVPPSEQNPLEADRLGISGTVATALDGIVLKCLEHRPTKRFQTAAELKARLLPLMEGTC